MSRPTDETFAAIVSAIAAIEADPKAPRTKAQIMRLSGLSHPTVHRVCRWDSPAETPFKINARWNEVLSAAPTRRSPERQEWADMVDELSKKRRDNSRLRSELALAQQVAAAAWLSRSADSSIVPLKKGRR